MCTYIGREFDGINQRESRQTYMKQCLLTRRWQKEIKSRGRSGSHRYRSNLKKSETGQDRTCHLTTCAGKVRCERIHRLVLAIPRAAPAFLFKLIKWTVNVIGGQYSTYIRTLCQKDKRDTLSTAPEVSLGLSLENDCGLVKLFDR